jgi:hypothetical protein
MCNYLKIKKMAVNPAIIFPGDQYLGFLCFGKQSLQYTGLPSVGTNGTSHSFPQSEHVVLCISLGPPKFLRPPKLSLPFILVLLQNICNIYNVRRG